MLRNDNETDAMRELKDLLDPLIDELGDAPDAIYIASSLATGRRSPPRRH
ncbi:hypothetical protein OG317_36415 [Streptomyces sp. NBC_01167]|nr:hypothetical protein OG317_36415 [Streptomyces sp. NBC_01167]